MTNPDEVPFSEEAFLKTLNTRMPFGKYKGTRLIELPESYVMWFARQGFPNGKLGEMLRSIYEIQLNGLDHSLGLRKLKN